jgi:hypothetical protein
MNQDVDCHFCFVKKDYRNFEGINAIENILLQGNLLSLQRIEGYQKYHQECQQYEGQLEQVPLIIFLYVMVWI